MTYVVEELNINELSSFHTVFTEVLKSEFPGYTPKVIQFFLEKPYTEFAFKYYLEQKQKTIFVAKENSTIVGFAIVDEPYGGVSFCRWLGVIKEHQRRGLGTLLINKWLEYAISLGCHKAEVASQPDSLEFYKKMELELEGHRKLTYFGIDQYIFGKMLGTPTDEVMTKYG